MKQAAGALIASIGNLVTELSTVRVQLSRIGTLATALERATASLEAAAAHAGNSRKRDPAEVLLLWRDDDGWPRCRPVRVPNLEIGACRTVPLRTESEESPGIWIVALRGCVLRAVLIGESPQIRSEDGGSAVVTSIDWHPAVVLSLELVGI